MQSQTSMTEITERQNMARDQSKVIVSTKTVTKKDKKKTTLHETLLNTEERANTVQNRAKR